jgi:hypothetical protein
VSHRKTANNDWGVEFLGGDGVGEKSSQSLSIVVALEVVICLVIVIKFLGFGFTNVKVDIILLVQA